MAAVQLNFSLRTSSGCKTVHLLGSWDGYRGQLPLSKDASKSGGWKGAFRFQGKTLRPGQRYWYYYIIDGYHVSHDPARDSVTEPTTGRKLNVLDIPNNKGGGTGSGGGTYQSSTRSSGGGGGGGGSRDSSARHSRHGSAYMAKGRPLSVSDIQSPRPHKPQETRKIRDEQFRDPSLQQFADRFARTHISAHASDHADDSDSDSDSDIGIASDSDGDNSLGTPSDVSSTSPVPSLTSRSSRSSRSSQTSSPTSSVSSCCTCERYGITRAGARVKLDCGGRRCGFSDGSECSSSSESEREMYRSGATRRNGIVVRQ